MFLSILCNNVIVNNFQINIRILLWFDGTQFYIWKQKWFRFCEKWQINMLITEYILFISGDTSFGNWSIFLPENAYVAFSPDILEVQHQTGEFYMDVNILIMDGFPLIYFINSLRIFFFVIKIQRRNRSKFYQKRYRQIRKL